MLICLSAKLMMWLWGVDPITEGTKMVLVILGAAEMVMVGAIVGAAILAWIIGNN